MQSEVSSATVQLNSRVGNGLMIGSFETGRRILYVRRRPPNRPAKTVHMELVLVCFCLCSEGLSSLVVSKTSPAVAKV